MKNLPHNLKRIVLDLHDPTAGDPFTDDVRIDIALKGRYRGKVKSLDFFKNLNALKGFRPIKVFPLKGGERWGFLKGSSIPIAVDVEGGTPRTVSFMIYGGEEKHCMEFIKKALEEISEQL